MTEQTYTRELVEAPDEMTAEEIADFVEQIVSEEGDCTFATIAQRCPAFSAASNAEIAHEYRAGPTILISSNMSKAGVDAINLLLRGHRLAVQPTSRFVYSYDGGPLIGGKNGVPKDWRPCLLVPPSKGKLAPNGILVVGDVPGAPSRNKPKQKRADRDGRT